MKLTPRQRFLWARAIISAAWAGADKLPITDFFIAGCKVLRAIFASPSQEISEDIYKRRIAVCECCSIWQAKTRTCGPAEFGGQVFGCRCFMDAKAALKDAGCWLRENTHLDSGWPDELMPPAIPNPQP